MGDSISIVFAGGGCRTFWSLGALSVLGDLVPVDEWAGVSAGAAMAVVSSIGLGSATVAHFKSAAAVNKKNAYWGNLVKHQPVFPHEAIYRKAIHQVLGDEGFRALKNGVPVKILLASVNAGAPRMRTVFRAMRAYRKRKINHIVHGPEVPSKGLSFEIVAAQQARTLDELSDQILASSSTPPVTKAPIVDDRMYVDGGFAENVPVRALSLQARAGKVLVLLTRPIPHELLPNSENRFYLAPSRPVPIKTWDYTSPEKLQETYDLGREDAKDAQREFDEFIGRVI